MDAIRGRNNPRLAYAGEIAGSETGRYLLGSRLYCPILRRFSSPGSLSPFDAGGVNRYAYAGADPMNRIDPSGGSWWEWALAGLGLVAAVAGAIASGGALAGLTGAAAAGSLTASTSTLSVSLMTAAAVADVVSVAADIGSTVSLSMGDTRMGALFGWMALGAGAASVGTARWLGKGVRGASAAGHLRAPVEPPSGFVRQRPVIPDGSPVDRNLVKRQMIRDPGQVPDGRLIALRDADEVWHVRMRINWVARSHGTFPGAFHFGSDTAIARKHVLPYLPAIARSTPVAPGNLYFYTGVHGHAMGRNWNMLGRMGADPASLTEDRAIQGQLAAAAQPHTLVVEDLANLTVAEARSAFARPGVHVHAYCYAAVDEVLLDMFGVTHAPPVYSSDLLEPVGYYRYQGHDHGR